MAAITRLDVRYPGGKRSIVVGPDQIRNVLTDILRQSDLPLNTRCGQRGQCDGCCVDLLAGSLVHVTSSEESICAEGQPRQLRACQYQLPAAASANIRIPPRSLLAHQPQVVSSFRINVPRAHDPLWQLVRVGTDELEPGMPLATRLSSAVARKRASQLPIQADPAWHDWTPLDETEVLTALEYGGNRWTLRPIDASLGCTYGAVVDVGTTTVVVLLVELSSGKVVAEASGLNAQTDLGDNVLTRINLCLNDPRMVEQLQRALVQTTLTPLLDQALAQAGVSAQQLVCLTIAGNMTMLHLVVGVNPGAMGVAPFPPGFLQHRVVRSSDLPWRDCTAKPVGPKAQSGESDATDATSVAEAGINATVHLLPGTSAYVGADVMAGVFASGMAYRAETCMLVDVGTNGEIILKHKEKILGCATAAGPAFEGAGLRCGMRAGVGAISHVRLEGDPAIAKIEVIGGGKPIGICGTAYVDVIAWGRRVRLIGPTGRFTRAPIGREAVQDSQHGCCLTVARGRGKEPIVVTEADVASLLQAKAAIAAGILCLLDRFGLKSSDVDALFLAGGFGFHMDVPNILDCGLLPGFSPAQIQLVGNTALAGAYLALLDSGVLEELKNICQSVETIELNLDPNFESHYIDELLLPEIESCSAKTQSGDHR